MELEFIKTNLSHVIVDMEDRSGDGMKRLRLTFANGYGISIISGWTAYGEYEIAVIGRNGSLDYSTSVTNDVEACDSIAEVYAYAVQISELD